MYNMKCKYYTFTYICIESICKPYLSLFRNRERLNPGLFKCFLMPFVLELFSEFF